jgi:hypothetical protein
VTNDGLKSVGLSLEDAFGFIDHFEDHVPCRIWGCGGVVQLESQE